MCLPREPMGGDEGRGPLGTTSATHDPVRGELDEQLGGFTPRRRKRGVEPQRRAGFVVRPAAGLHRGADLFHGHGGV
ncbi:MAG: hypothetical protein ACK5QX_04385, partial [bacterium]